MQMQHFGQIHIKLGLFMRERSDTNTLGNLEDQALKGKSRRNKRQNEQLKETIYGGHLL